jgi:DNA-binding GntR family transcriptional regulator
MGLSTRGKVLRAATHKIKRQGLPETLAESLRERILNGEFQEGEALIQDAIAREYDVSRMPVREALRQLEASGLVALHLHKGAVVTALPEEEILELFELRARLEGDVLTYAIAKLTDEQLEASSAILSDLESAYRQRDIANWGRLNWEFHRSLYVASLRVRTLAILEGINLQTDRYIRLQLLLTGAIADAEEEHREILRLCTLRDTGRAVPYLRTHILNAGRDLMGALRAHRAAKAVGA